MLKDKQVMSWALYDWANSVFATVVMAGFFPIVFKQYWAADLSSDESTFWLGVSNSTASLLIVILAPLLGTMADLSGTRKRMLLISMAVGVLFTLFMYPVSSGYWWLALLFYLIASIGFMAANIFYDALIIDVSRQHHIDHVSGLGFGMGYLGGGILLAICVYISQNAELFGFANSMQAVLFCFVISALWWFVFSMPLAFWVKEGGAINNSKKPRRNILAELKHTFSYIMKDKNLKLFLIAYWLYIDGVDTIIRMSVDYGLALGFDSGDLIAALLITQFVGFPAAIIYGYLGNKFGVKPAIIVAIMIYGIITLLAFYMTDVQHFYYLAIMIGLVQGGIQALSRSFYARIIPEQYAAEYFGIYNMMGKSAVILGPIIMGSVALMTNNHRYSILSILILFIVGLIVFLFVKDPSKKSSI